MMKQEFEKIAGYEVSWEDYSKVIEPMYMATDMSKQDFVKCLDEKRFSLTYKKRELVKKMRKIANFLYENCGRHAYCEECDNLEELVKEYAGLFIFHDTQWRCDFDNWLFWDKGYEYELEKRGCTYYKAVTIMRKGHQLETIKLLKTA